MNATLSTANDAAPGVGVDGSPLVTNNNGALPSPSNNNVADLSNFAKVDNDASHSSLETDTSTVVDEIASEQKIAARSSTLNASVASSPSSDHSSLTVSTDEDDDDDDDDEGASQLASLPSKRRKIMEHNLPSTCTVLSSSKTGGKVYLVGTAHFSKESQVRRISKRRLILQKSIP